MFLLPIKQTNKIDLFTPLLRNLKEMSGAQISEQAKPILQKLQTLRNDLADISTIRNDSSAVNKAAGEIKEYLSIWNCIGKSFSFGTDKESINVNFTWYDAYTKEKINSINPMTERVGMLYNLGVMYSQMGTDIANLSGDKVKEAANLFLTAAWIFERIKLDLVNLKLTEFTSDVSERNLAMCSFLMKAQAQSCAYKRVQASRPDRYDLLAKLAMQASKYYEVANGYSKAVGVEKAPDGKSLLGIMQFKEGAFKCYAFYWLALSQKKKCEESVMGMGKAVASIQKALECLDTLRKNEKDFPLEAMTECKTLYSHCAELKKTIEGLNDKLYHESVPSRPVEIDVMPYGKPISIEGELDKPFEGKEILSLTVPPKVRALNNEYRKEVGVIIEEAFEMIRQLEDYQTQVLKKYNLPSSIHASFNEQKIPDDMWQRIKKCKENGGIHGLNQIMEAVDDLAKCNKDNIQTIQNQLKGEQKEDIELREKYGSKWSRLPSSGLNGNMLKQLEEFKKKYEVGRDSDNAIKKFAHADKKEFDLIELDRDALTNKIPKSNMTAGELTLPAAK